MGIKHSKGKLSKVDKKFLVKHTRFSAEEIKKWYKTFKTECPNGEMDYDKLLEVYKGFYPGSDPTNFTRYAFKVCDHKNRGYIGWKDFIMILNVTSSDETETKLRWAFKLIDINEDNRITLNELTQLISGTYRMQGDSAKHIQESPFVRARKIFDSLNANQDDFLTEEEFVHGCMNDPVVREMLFTSFKKRR